MLSKKREYKRNSAEETPSVGVRKVPTSEPRQSKLSEDMNNRQKQCHSGQRLAEVLKQQNRRHSVQNDAFHSLHGRSLLGVVKQGESMENNKND